jgi:hypothetical protein
MLVGGIIEAFFGNHKTRANGYRRGNREGQPNISITCVSADAYWVSRH